MQLFLPPSLRYGGHDPFMTHPSLAPLPHTHMQNFFRAYPKLGGMTGTAATEAPEFSNIYNLPVTVVPTNRRISRTDNPDVVFRCGRGWGRLFTHLP